MSRRRIFIIICAALFLTGFLYAHFNKPTIYLTIPADRYPEAAQHAHDAIEAGHSPTCTVDRGKSTQRREQSLATTPVRSGFDRDEFPMAMCKEGGKGADIRYIDPHDNRGAGAWVAHKVKDYPNGTKIIFQN